MEENPYDPKVFGRRYKNQANLPMAPNGGALQSVLAGSPPMDNRTAAIQEFMKQNVNAPGKSASVKTTGPATVEEMSQPLISSGLQLALTDTGELIDDGKDLVLDKNGKPVGDRSTHLVSKKALTLDPRAFESKLTPQLEEVLKYQRERPTDLDFSSVADFVNMMSTTGRKVTAPKQRHSADQAADEQTNLMRLIQKEKDNEQENQLKVLGDLSKMMSFAPSITQAISQPHSGAGLARLNRLSDPQVKEINNLDKLISSLKTIKGKAAGHPEWVGPVDRWKPDWAIGPDHSAFRSEAGQLEDTYRSATTGAAAPFKELEILRGRLPTERDPHPNFLKKADEAIIKAEEIKRRVLESYRNQGKTVDPGFETSPAPYGGYSERLKTPAGPAPSASQILESLRKK